MVECLPQLICIEQGLIYICSEVFVEMMMMMMMVMVMMIIIMVTIMIIQLMKIARLLDKSRFLSGMVLGQLRFKHSFWERTCPENMYIFVHKRDAIWVYCRLN